MSKTTFTIIAGVSAATGAGITAAMYSTRSEKKIQAAASSTAVTASSTSSAHSPVPLPVGQSIIKDVIAPVDHAGLFQYGFPGPVAELATRNALISSFDRRLRNPSWVAEHITPASLATQNGDRKHSYFVEDPSVPEKFRGKLKDYARSGYDRGHQVPAADAKWSQEAMNDTLFLTNIVRIVTGPLYLPKRDPADGKWRVTYEVIGNQQNIAVPTHFYKVIFAEDGTTAGPVAVGAFVLPNARIPNEKPLTDFEVPVEMVERASGLEFMTKLPAQRRKRLCDDMMCALVIKDYSDRQKAFAKDSAPRRTSPRHTS
ncbi:hypothetical protein BOTNAR_0174g00120 [Botryotinia narcissicola]|uniref:Endonuclease n=1 Tax=Botryotinia narcissicola TaxID=278944 RepID=A0A4Z1IGV5_9HELO|nr:hypothetical protein BOTNAR_0174g00120 [Botryotinia narcissicola]